LTFDLEACRFHLAARNAIRFPPGMAGNVLRGALGSALRATADAQEYEHIFQPSAAAGPSGFADRPRPFVLRGAELNGRVIEPGQRFCFGLHLFDPRDAALGCLTRAFAHWAELISVQHERVTVDLGRAPEPASRIRVIFHTPTELKAQGQVAKGGFSVLLARARDRVSSLRSLYGAGPLEIDFRALAERARAVVTLASELQPVAIARRSGSTGQRHSIGGVIGHGIYEGDLTEFMPYLEAASWAGVGRHCTWGNGQITTEILA
jgi:hypothetical protein